LVPGIAIVDKNGRNHVVKEVLDDDLVSIESGTVADFSSSMVRGVRETHVVGLESVVMRESYRIGLWASDDPLFLTYLYSVVAFVLHRYRQWLLEARGFQGSQLSWSSFEHTKQFAPKLVYYRQCVITGKVRNSWPKSFAPEIQGVGLGPDLQITRPEAPGEVFVNEDGVVGGDADDPYTVDEG
jgi:hypothetical protein